MVRTCVQEEDLETTSALGQTKTRWEMGAVMKRCRQGAHICHYSSSYNLITIPRLWGTEILRKKKIYGKEHKFCGWKMPLSIIPSLCYDF